MLRVQTNSTGDLMGHVVTAIVAVLATLKLTGYADISWFVVFAPWLISIGFCVFVILACLLFATICAVMDR